jgi:hypothetical protein
MLRPRFGYTLANITGSTTRSSRTAKREFVRWIGDGHPNAHGEIKRAFADGDFVILHCQWIGLISDAWHSVSGFHIAIHTKPIGVAE